MLVGQTLVVGVGTLALKTVVRIESGQREVLVAGAERCHSLVASTAGPVLQLEGASMQEQSSGPWAQAA